VQPRVVWHYHHLIEQLVAGETDIVWLPPVLALRAIAAGQVDPIALPVRHGESSYRTVLFARRDAAVREVGDLAGVRAAWVDRQSAAGYLILRAHLLAAGVDLARAFSEEVFCGAHDAVAAAVDQGRADVGATFAYLDEEEHVKRAGFGARDMRIIAHAGPIPNDIVAARRGLPSLLVRVIQSALVDALNVELREAARVLLAADGFVVPPAGHFDPMRRLLAGLEEPGDTPHSMFPPPP
jgi:phosphonate transport system substrate-binding protein